MLVFIDSGSFRIEFFVFEDVFFIVSVGFWFLVIVLGGIGFSLF